MAAPKRSLEVWTSDGFNRADDFIKEFEAVDIVVAVGTVILN